MSASHVLINEESTSGTFLAPSQAYPVMTFGRKSGKEYLDIENTGSGYDLDSSWGGAYAPSGNISMLAYEEMLGELFKVGGFPSITSTQDGATDAYTHGILPNPATTLETASMQGQDTSAAALSLRGAFINKFVFACKAKSPLEIKMDWIARDAVYTGGTWGDGNAAPAVATPTYFADTVGLFHFAGAYLTLDGTVSLNTTTNQSSVSGGTSIVLAEMAELTIDHQAIYKHMLGTVFHPTVLTRQKRKVTGRLEVDWSAVDTTFYAAMLAASQHTLQLRFVGSLIDVNPYNYELVFTMPHVKFREAELPDIVGNKSQRKQTLNFTAQSDSAFVDTNGVKYELGINLTDQQTSY